MKKDKGENQEVNNIEDVEPVHFGKRAVWGILIGLCVLLLLIFMVIYTAPKGGTPKIPTQSSKVENTDKTGSDESSKSGEEESSKQSETVGNSDEVSWGSSDESNSEDKLEGTYTIRLYNVEDGMYCTVYGCWFNPITGEQLTELTVLHQGIVPESRDVTCTVEIPEVENAFFATGFVDEEGRWINGDKEMRSLFVKEVVQTPTPQEPQGTQSEEGLLPLTQEPALNGEVTTSGMVSGKGMYKIGNSYTYGVNIIIVTGNDAKLDCQYFCPRNTYSALGIGDAITVTYQMDYVGNVSISSISR